MNDAEDGFMRRNDEEFMFSDNEAFEGDMLDFDENTVKSLQHPQPHFMSANKNADRKWPDGIIPYVLQEDFSDEFRVIIRDAMKIIEDVTCIRYSSL